MHTESLSYDQLPFSPLFKDYTQNFEQLASFYNYNPFNNEDFDDSRKRVIDTFPLKRETLVDWLADFNAPFNPSKNSKRNIERLKNDDAVVFVTGQQVSLLGGPLYTVYKTLTTIHLAHYWEEQWNVPVIPVFWLADEDHDYDEVKHVRLPKSDSLYEMSYDNPQPHFPAASKVEIDSGFDQILEYLQQEMRDTDFSDSLWDIIEDAYKQGNTLGNAFGTLLMSIFSSQGLILAGSHDSKAKNLAKEPLKVSVERVDEIREALDKQTRQIENDYHKQVTVFDSNLFLHAADGRTKIQHKNGTWSTETGEQWTRQELLTDIEEDPSRFSPNVFLRPILQDHLLPTVAYVGGPGEIAYYGQMKSMYKAFDREMPVIFPRLSATVVESKIDRIYKKLPFNISEYQQRIEDLESQYAREVEELEVDDIFDHWKREVQQLSDEKSEQIKEIDPTLVKAVGKATAVYFNELDKLRGKVHRSTKQQEETQLNRIRKIKYQLFPENTLQERVISFIFYMNKYGLDLWDQMYDQLSFEESYRKHQIIYL